MAETNATNNLSEKEFGLLKAHIYGNRDLKRLQRVVKLPKTPTDPTPPVVDVVVTKTDAGKAQTGYDLVAQCLRETVEEFANYPNTQMDRISDPESSFRTTIDLVEDLKKKRKEAEQYFDKSPLMTTATLEWPKELTRKGNNIRIAFRDLVNQFGKDAGLSGKQLDDPKVRAAAIFGATTLMEMYDGEASGFYGTETFDPRYLYDWTHKKSDREKVLGRVTTAALPTIFKTLRAYFAGKASAGLVSDTLGGLSTALSPIMKYINNIVPTGQAGFYTKAGLGIATGWWTGFITTVLDWVTKLFNSQFMKKFSAAGFRDASLMFVHELIRDVVVHAMLDKNLILTEYIVFWRAGIQFVLVLASALIPVFIQRRYNLPMESQRRVFGASNALDMTRPDGIRVTNENVDFQGRRAEKILQKLHKQMARYAISQSQSMARTVSSWFLTLITPRDFDTFALQIIGYSLFKEIIFMTTEQPKSEHDGSPTDPEEMVAVSYDGKNRLINTKNGTGSIDIRWLPGRKTDDHWTKELEKWRSDLHKKLGRGTSVKGLNNAIAPDGSSWGLWGDSLWDQVKYFGNLGRPGALGEDTSTFYDENIVNFAIQTFRVQWADKTSSKESSSVEKLSNLWEFNTDIFPCVLVDTGNEGTTCTWIAKPLAGAGSRIAEWFGYPESLREGIRLLVKARHRYVRMSNSSAKELQAEADIQTVARTVQGLGKDVLDMHHNPKGWTALYNGWPELLFHTPVTVKDSNLTVTGRELEMYKNVSDLLDKNASAAEVNTAFEKIEHNFNEKLKQKGLSKDQRIEIGRNMAALRDTGEGLFLERGFNSTEFSAFQYADTLNAVIAGNLFTGQKEGIVKEICTGSQAPLYEASLDFAEKRTDMPKLKGDLQKLSADQNVEGQKRVAGKIQEFSDKLEQLDKNVSYEPPGYFASIISNGGIDASLSFEEITENLKKAKQLSADVTQIETQNKTLKDTVVENNSTTQLQWGNLKTVKNIVKLLETQQKNKLLDGFSEVVQNFVKKNNKIWGYDSTQHMYIAQRGVEQELVKKGMPEIEGVEQELKEVQKRLEMAPNTSYQENLDFAIDNVQWMLMGKQLNASAERDWTGSADLAALKYFTSQQEHLFDSFKKRQEGIKKRQEGKSEGWQITFSGQVTNRYTTLTKTLAAANKLIVEHNNTIIILGQNITEKKNALQQALQQFNGVTLAAGKKAAQETLARKALDVIEMCKDAVRTVEDFNKTSLLFSVEQDEGSEAILFRPLEEPIARACNILGDTVPALSDGNYTMGGTWDTRTNIPQISNHQHQGFNITEWFNKFINPAAAAGAGLLGVSALPPAGLTLSIPLMGMSGVREKKQQSRL